MKKFLLGSFFAFLLIFAPLVMTVSAQTPSITPDTSIYDKEEFAPVRKMVNIALAIALFASVSVTTVLVVKNGIQLQNAGDNINKANEAKQALKNTLIGLGISFSALFIINLILSLMGIAGIKIF